LQSAGHGVVGGGLSEATGGNFKDGFIGAAAGAMLSPVSGYMNENLGFGKAGTGNGWQLLGRTATAATVGGTVTAISGGKFANGAATAAFMHFVNAEATEFAKILATYANAKDLGKLPQMAAEWRGRDGSWNVVETQNGAALVEALHNHFLQNGRINRWEHFSHGYEGGKGPAVYGVAGAGSLYINGFNPVGRTADARWISDIDPKWFAPDSRLNMHACGQGGSGGFAEQRAVHIGSGTRVTASTSGQSFYTTPGGLPSSAINESYRYVTGGKKPLYLVPTNLLGTTFSNGR
jgi:hypothetical protein